MDELDPIIREFLVESRENLDQLDRDLVAIEEDPKNREMLDRIFRTIHSIKGTCGFLAFSKLESVAHAGESLLCRLRDGLLLWRPETTTHLLALVDAVRAILTSIEATGNEGDGDFAELVASLIALQETPTVEPLPPFASSPLDALSCAGQDDLATEPGPEPDDGEAINTRIEEPIPECRGSETPSAVDSAAAASIAARSNGTIRVDVELLDKLMNLVGELVLARNQILQFTSTRKDVTLQGTSQRLNLITTELQEGVMKTRMQPIGNIWSKFPRVVRDLALTCGRQVRIEMEGKETELDKTIIEAIKDPLTHIVRNAVDHGIETPNARRRKGKSPTGCLRLHAYHESGKVNIEITDDGSGIDPERIKQKALEKGLITHEQATRMSDREIIQLIFLPGFSTAEKVTTVSGRGVGMDVVRTNIEKIGGSIEIHSRPGLGTKLKIKIPLTLAIIPALIITSGGSRYAIPQVNLLELVRLEGEETRHAIEMVHGAPIFRLRGNLLPLVFLGKELGDASSITTSEHDVTNIVVLQADDRQFGLVVQGINDTEEIVVKPLGKQLKGLSLFAGATIMGDGNVSLILDVPGIAQRTGVISEMRDRKLVDSADEVVGEREDQQTVLLFGVEEDRRMAMPLSMVARLEEISP